ncbi:hypothetical protein G7Y89_g15197 [Cudoniella acicularis]|uniref:Uncharacterized protein n=1 Tax=Cudoniella acicularis TaxID=354080 RepID=A0A8H4QS62_9HELO|nr:hypothetical protein G7Y89_g15197 [Cudoniella acicularis]
MGAIGSITWPHLVPINTQQTLQQSTSSMTRSSSIQGLIARPEPEQMDCAPRRNSEGDQSFGTPFPLMSPLSEQPLGDVLITTETSTAADGGANSMISPSSPVSRPMDLTADGLQTLPPLPDTALGLSRYEHGEMESFDTSMRPLLQSRPDSPIGGEEAAPMKNMESSLGTRAIRGSVHTELPRIEISSPKDSLTGYVDAVPLRSRSNFSDPCYEASRSGCDSWPQSPKSEGTPNMVTAPDTPGRNQRNENTRSEFSFDGPGQGGLDDGIAVTDFAENSQACFAPECAAYPLTERLNGLGIAAPGGPDIPSGTELYILDVDGKRITKGMLGIPSTDDPAPEMLPMPQAEGAIPNAELSQLPNAPGLDTTVPTVTDALGVPFEVTGQLPSPPPLKKPKGAKSNKFKRGSSKAIRKGRSFVLRKPVLSLVIGRKLSGPTATALKLISNGVDIQPPEIRKSVVPLPDAGGPTPI